MNIDNTVGSTYDGTFTFFVDLQLEPGADELTELSVWDGDLDRGDFDGANSDTDDPNTPNDVLPDFDINEISAFEGIAIGTAPSTGAPPDDVDLESQGGFGIYNRRSPSIRYTVTAPDTTELGANNNPSGNREWEEYRVATGPFDPNVSDDSAVRLSAGAYRVQLRGMDMNNLNAWFFGAAVLCQKSNTEACDSPPKPYLLGDLVWEDPNGNQVQDPGEPGIPEVIVNLVDAAGNVIATTITDENGNYEFDVDSGLYTVEVDPANFDGPTPTGAVGDFVWLDLDRDGVQDGNEPPIPQVEVVLLDSGPDGTVGTADDRTLGRTQTDNDGFYFFAGLETALYYTAVDDDTLPGGLTLSGGSDPSDTRPIFIDETFRDLDYGYIGVDDSLAGIGDFVWSDLDNDGVQDPGEPGISGITLIVKGPGEDGEFGTDDDVQIDNGATVGGFYLFTELEPGSYQVEITDDAGVLAGYSQTAAPGTLVVAADEYNLTGDFGYFSDDLHSVADVVWFDTDRDGVLDPGEFGLEGVSIALLDANGDNLANTVTDVTGDFSFDGLPDGSYELVITDFGNVLSDLLPTTIASVNTSHPVEIVGADVSGIDFGWIGTGVLDGWIPTTPSPTQTNTVVDANVLTYDFGYTQTGSIGDTIWQDDDGDGVQDPGEPGIPGVTVTLKDGDGNILDVTVTDANGMYVFDDLPAGNYTICVDPTTLPPGYEQTGDPDRTLDDETTIVLGPGEDNLDGDFGYQPPPDLGSIGDRVWFDRDGDGVQDPGEPGIPGVTVLLKDEDGNVLDETTTGPNGIYLFSDLPAGIYTVCIDEATLPGDLVQTGDPDGNLDGETTIVLAPGQNELDGDFGYNLPTCTEGSVLDEFDVIAYDNNDGTLDWATPWFESDPFGGGASGGNVRIVPEGALRIGDDPDSGAEPSATRVVDLTDNASAQLRFDFVITSGADPEDEAVFEVSIDGGNTFFVVETFNGIVADKAIEGSLALEVSRAVGNELFVRFRIVSGYGSLSEYLYIDNLEVVCGC